MKGLKRNISWTVAMVRQLRGPNHASILCYHAVAEPEGPGAIAPHRFGAHVEWLAGHCDVVSLQDVLAGAQGVALTFDDGYRSMTTAGQTLAVAGLPYAVAVPTGHVGGRAAWDERAEFDTQLLSWDEVNALPGAATVVSHGHEHVDVRTLSDDELHRQLVLSQKLLHEQVVGPAVLDVLVWPYGAYDHDAEAVARRAGFRATLAGGWGDGGRPRFTRRRLGVETDDTAADLAVKIAGGCNWLDLVRRARGG
ncbi:MAG: polysaccharide deacetylase [Actinomycetia bacterium]|nr:polysaccharide deacetylase [Actinomycetes bacterium]